MNAPPGNAPCCVQVRASGDVKALAFVPVVTNNEPFQHTARLSPAGKLVAGYDTPSEVACMVLPELFIKAKIEAFAAHELGVAPIPLGALFIHELPLSPDVRPPDAPTAYISPFVLLATDDFDPVEPPAIHVVPSVEWNDAPDPPTAAKTVPFHDSPLMGELGATAIEVQVIPSGDVAPREVPARAQNTVPFHAMQV